MTNITISASETGLEAIIRDEPRNARNPFAVVCRDRDADETVAVVYVPTLDEAIIRAESFASGRSPEAVRASRANATA